MASVDLLTPSKIGAPGSLNFDTRNVGRAVPSFKHFVLSDTDRKHYFGWAFETKAPTGTTYGAAPRQYAGADKSVYRLDNGTITDDTSALSGGNLGDVVMGAALFNPGGFGGDATAVAATTLTDTRQAWPTNYFTNRTLRMGGSTATITSNTATVLTFSGGWTGGTPTLGPYTIDPTNTPSLLVTFGTSSTIRSARRDMSTDTTPWTQNTDATYAQLWGIVRIGGAGYAGMTDAGETYLGEHRISICPLGNDPQLKTSWGNGFEIGGPEWGITGISAIGNAPVIGKPDGLYYYDVQTRRYENVLKNYELIPHALNGKVTESITGGVVYTTHDGHAYFFDGVSVTEISPNKFWPILSRDIGNSRITAVADSGDFIAMVTETAYQTAQNQTANAQGNKIVVNKVTSAGAATAITTNVIDGSMATGGDISNLASTSFIDVWSPTPFEGVVIHVTRLSNSTTTAVIGSVAYSSATDTFTADANGFIDGTRLSSNGSFSYVAFPPSASAGCVYGKSLNWGTLQQAVTFNYASGTDITTPMYGMRIGMSVADLDGTVNIDELEIIPTRTGMPNGGIYGVTTNFTHRDRAGLINHVYLLKREKTTGFIPHDAYAVNAYPGVWKMSWHTGRLGQAGGAQNLGQSLILWGRYRTIAINESITRDPVRSRFPLIQQVGTAGPGPLIQIAHEWAGKSRAEWEQYKELNTLKFDTRFVQPTDEIEIFIQHDDEDIISAGVFQGGPLFMKELQNIKPFRYCNLWIGFKQAATALPNAPYFVEPYVLNYGLSTDADAKDKATATPETT